MPPYHKCGRMPPQSSGRTSTSIPAASSALAARSASMRMRNVRMATSCESAIASILAGACSDRVEKTVAEVCSLALADTVHGPQGGRGCRLETCHLSQGGAVEDHVRRHVALAGDRETHRAQRVEQLAIDAIPRLGFRARPPRLPVLDGASLPRERQIRVTRAVFQQLQPFPGELEHRISVLGLPQEAVSRELFDIPPYFGH